MTARTRQWLLLVLLIAAAVFASLQLLAPRAAAPDFLLLNGERLPQASLRGRPLLLVFWATNCPPCVHEAPALAALYRARRAQEFEIVAVAMPYDPPANVLAFARAQKLPYKIALDLDGAVTRHYEVGPIPRALLFAADGERVWDKLGALDLGQLRADLARLSTTDAVD